MRMWKIKFQTAVTWKILTRGKFSPKQKLKEIKFPINFIS